MIRKSTGILCCGSLGKEYFQKYGARPEQIFLYPYEPDYDLIFNLSSEVIEKTRRQFNLTTNRRRIIFSGRLDSPKRPDLVLGSFLAIADRVQAQS